MSGGLHGRVVDMLGREISAGVHPPGSVLRIEELEQRFEISRSVAREVVRTLASLRMVLGRKRVGVVVRPRSEWNTFDPNLIRWLLAADRVNEVKTLVELRTAVEPVAAGAAAQRASGEDADRLVELAGEMTAHAEAGDLNTFLDCDVAFHSLMLAASGNEMFAQLHEVVEEVLRWRTGMGLMPERPAAIAVRLHREIAECVHGGDRERAESAMRELVAEAFEGTLELLEQQA
ncbi:DNA-binding FadR family transcriptional regulator [Saccharopolyspora lacisalsi]|uniref:DNA-binding FadR family transcriptional regulator n=1 Tax=Halosaccharopolyspora lacisalsi TaxID=1000566 RepID=A0A839DV20_9PSEU|nr:FCD domain-containing protein [Halosaccharopolyspora lacisalsi]MBA8825832.1 DNA-binding FadR family transcriptional regulator [Halosaccharopolyspora lacisalsi]